MTVTIYQTQREWFLTHSEHTNSTVPSLALRVPYRAFQALKRPKAAPTPPQKPGKTTGERFRTLCRICRYCRCYIYEENQPCPALDTGVCERAACPLILPLEKRSIGGRGTGIAAMAWAPGRPGRGSWTLP